MKPFELGLPSAASHARREDAQRHCWRNERFSDQVSSLRLLLSRNVNPAASKIASRIVSEGGLEPPCPFGALAPQASASTYSATRTGCRLRGELQLYLRVRATLTPE